MGPKGPIMGPFSPFPQFPCPMSLFWARLARLTASLCSFGLLEEPKRPQNCPVGRELGPGRLKRGLEASPLGP